MKVKVNDRVLVISGKDKNKKSKVIRVIAKNDQIVVEKVNMRTKHIKKSQGKAGEKITYEAPMSSAKVAIMCPSCNKAVRAGYKTLANGKKDRVCKKCHESLDKSVAETGTKTKAKVQKVKAE